MIGLSRENPSPLHILPASVADATDGSLTTAMQAHDSTGLTAALQRRQLHKRALDLPASEVPELPSWIWDDPDALERAVIALARYVHYAV